MIQIRFFLLLLFLQFVLNVVQSDLPKTIIRQTSNGPIEGVEQISSLKQKYYAFRGIPYAEPPITGNDPYTGEKIDRRFKAPEPLKRNWTKALKVHDFGKICMPTRSNMPIVLNFSEDCLFLNIYIPVSSQARIDPLTVLVFIHGGAFVGGDATDQVYGPDFLLASDSVIVTLQYRLGIFGFLNLGHGEYTGNMGLKDQQLALKWIHENIEQFSGNKNEVLLFGQSAGGASVHFHMYNEQSRKYFQRVYAASGTMFTATIFNKTTHWQRIPECFGVNGSRDQIMEFLKKTDGRILGTCCPFVSPGEIQLYWTPTIENQNTTGAFLTQTPEEIFNSKKAPFIDTIFSYASQEMVYFMPNLLKNTEPLLKMNWNETSVHFPFDGFTKEKFPDLYKRVVETLREVYYSDADNIDAIKSANIAVMSDLTFDDSIIKAVLLQAIANNNKSTAESEPKNTFLFRFSANTELKSSKIVAHLEFNGSTHADDLCYLFHCHRLDNTKVYEKHLKSKDEIYSMIMRSVKMITNFARTGDPSIDGDTPFKLCRSSNEFFCQEISNELKSHVTNDILEQLHYNTWRTVDQIVALKDETNDDGSNRLIEDNL